VKKGTGGKPLPGDGALVAGLPCETYERAIGAGTGTGAGEAGDAGAGVAAGAGGAVWDVRPCPEKRPQLGAGVFIAPGARVVGDVTLGDGASVWYNAVLRGDVAGVRVGRGSNIQDMTVIHQDFGADTVVGENVTVGHACVLHSCTIQDGALIGMGSCILGGAVVGAECLVGARALITGGKVFPPRKLIVGSPARAVRDLTAEEVESLRRSAEHYRAEAAAHVAGLSREGGKETA
jgi:carbonic anhydrase/acetyltransferase-like protein (isoleucine patch superfamily)